MAATPLLAWLLDAATPSIRYQTLTTLLDLPADNTRVAQAWRALRREGPAPAILAKQTRAGHWAGERSYYTPKYTSTHWSLLLLAELGLDGTTAGLRRGADFMLAVTAAELEHKLTDHTGGLACFWGNLLRYTLQAGRAGAANVEPVTRYLALELGTGCRCEHNAGYACAWGVARALWGLAALGPRPGRRVREAITQGVSYLLESHHLARADFAVPAGSRTSDLWFQLNFPLFYQADLLFTLRALGEVGQLDHPGAQPALDWLEQRRRPDGRWAGASPYGSRTWRELGGREETSRWLTVQALRVLRQAGRPLTPSAC